MKIVFISNYLNHHQIPLCEAFIKIPNVEFTFIATQKVEEERCQLGWLTDFSNISYASLPTAIILRPFDAIIFFSI